MKQDLTAFPTQDKKTYFYRIFSFLSFITALFLLSYGFMSQRPQKEAVLAPTPDPLAVYSEKVTALVKIKDPEAALAYVEKEIQINQEMMGMCHPLVHLIGHLAYEKYGDFATAISYQNDTCGSGYLHGVIEEKFASITDPVKEMQTICATVPKDEQDDCYHGVGHGLMYYNENDIPKSISMCQTYSNSTAVTRCAEGVYMENFSTTEESLHSTQYLKETDPFYPCNEQPESTKSVCYFYSSIYYLHLYPRQYVQGLNHCLKAEKKYQYSCAKGIGSRLMKENLTDINLDENTCNQAPASLRVPCIEGLTSYHLVNYDSQEKTRILCQQLEAANQATCLQYLSKNSLNFGE